MPFSPKIKEEALLRSRRCCCVCHEFAGVYTNVHHIEPEAEGGAGELTNAIVLCLRCHGEAGHYNPDHPIGNKYSRSELRRHRDEWWKWCEGHPGEALPKDPIGVSPASFRLASGPWTSKITAKITNRADRPYYAVYVKFRLEPGDMKLGTLSIEPITKKAEMVGSVGPVEVTWDHLLLSGTDESGADALYLVIGSIDPGETMTVSVCPKDGTKEGELTATVTLAQFENEPVAVLSKANGVAVPIKLPEAFALASMSVSMRRNQ